MQKPLFFISHINEDSQIAITIQDWLIEKLSGSVDIFVSSDKRRGLKGGDEWWDKIREKLKVADLVFLIITRRSQNRRWVYFEAGGSYFLGKRTIPLLLGVTIRDLNPPLDKLQALNILDPRDVSFLLNQITSLFMLSAMDDGKLISSKLEKLDSEIASAYVETIDVSQIENQNQEISDVDALNILETWMGQQSDNTHAIFFAKVDTELKLPKGTAERLIEQAAKRWGYRTRNKGPQTILFEEIPDPDSGGIKYHGF